MRVVSFILVLAFFFSEVATATTCDLLDGAYVEASDGTYLGFFGAGSASESIANSSGLYGSSAGVNSVRNSSGLYGSSSGLNSANNSVSLNPPKIYTGVQFLGFLSTNTTKSPRVEVETAVADCSFTESTPKRVDDGFLSLDLNSSTSISFFGNNKAGYKIDVVQAGALKINVISPDGVNYRLYNSSSSLLGSVDCSAISDCDEAAFSFESDGKDINVAVESESTGILYLVAGPTADYISGSGNITISFEASPEADVDPPQLVSWSLTPTSIDASQSDASVVVTLRVTDNSSGASTPLLVASHDSGQQTGFASVVRIDGDALDGTYEATLTVPKGGAPGIWSISLYPLEDAAGNDSSGFGPGPDYVSDFQNEVIDSDDDGVRDLDDDFPSDPTETTDTDADGIGDNADAFPLDPFEAFDTDGDGIGNNSDLDDDNDGFTDEEELAEGTNPLSRFSCRSGCFSFDVDESLQAQPLTDGLLVIRHLFGFSGDALTSGAVSGDASRDASDVIASYLTDADSELDIDGDGESKPLTDGLLLIRYLFGFSGDSLISGAIGDGAERDTADAVEAYIRERVPAS